MDVHARLEAQKEEIARLEERVAYLESALGMDFIAPVEWRLTTKESAVLGVIMAREIAPKNAILLAVYQEMDQPEEKIVDVFVCKIRKKLEPFGIQIDTLWGRGYYLTVENKAKINKRMEQLATAVIAAE